MRILGVTAIVALVGCTPTGGPNSNEGDAGGPAADLARPADLAGVDLAGVDLAGVAPAGVDLAGIDLAGVDLAGVDLASGDLAHVGGCVDNCTANLTKCVNGNQSSCVRLASGCLDWTLPSTCNQGMTCPGSGDHCVAAQCRVGDTQCSGNSVQTCDVTGSWVTTMNCPQACMNGACTAVVACNAGAVRCNNSDVEICNSSGSAWLYNATCNVGCNGGLCTDPCAGGATRCHGSTIETCNLQGTGWTAGTMCPNGCFKGACVDPDLIVDGITKTLDGEIKLANSVVVKNGGQIKVGASGKLILRAKTVSIDASSSIVATGVGVDNRGTPAYGSCFLFSSCSNLNICCNNVYGNTTTISLSDVGGASYGLGGATQPGTTNQCYNDLNNFVASNCPAAAGSIYDHDSDLSISEGSRDISANPGGGMVAIYADQVTVAGQIQANGTASASGGGVLIAADTLIGAGPIQAAGGSTSPTGGVGRVKLLQGATSSFTGAITGRSVASVMPPLDLGSGSHPDPSKWYNDGVGDLYVAWSKPFPTVNNYYYLVSTNPQDVPSDQAGRGAFLQIEQWVVPAALLKQGANYFHIIAVNSGFTLGTVENVFQANVNTHPPDVASNSHPNSGTWYQNNAISLNWTNPQADSNYTGYDYIFDHFADTVPSTIAGTFTTNAKLIIANVADGIWVFHLVNRDTRGATTITARHFIVDVGAEPAKGNISGSVFDSTNNNAPVPGAAIRINRGITAAATDQNGTYTFSNTVYAGTWEVSVSAPGFQPQAKTVTVVAGQTVNQNFSLTK